MKKLPSLQWTRKKTALAVSLAVIIAILIFVKSVTGPAVGTIEAPNSAEPAAQTYEPLNGKNFSLSYPSSYRLEDTGQHAVNILESYRLVASPARGGLARVVAVTIYDVPGGNLIDTSSYKSRKDKPGEYKFKTTQLGGHPAELVTSNLTSETVAFTKKGSMVAAIGFSGGVNAEGAEDEYNQILNSWKWE